MSATRRSLRLAICQLNPTVGDIAGNAELLVEAIGRAGEQGAQLVLTPELAVCGYPPEDLLAKPHFVSACAEAVGRVARESPPELVALLGFPERQGALYNALAVIHGGEIHGTYHKTLLPNYGVFDERRFFEPGEGGALIEVNGVRIGLTICEDIWFAGPPASNEALAGAGLIVNASASPYHSAKGNAREEMVEERARENECSFALCNLIGGQDELVFDGHSVVVGHQGRTIARADQFAEDLLICDLDLLVHDENTIAAGRQGGVRMIAGFEVPEPDGSAGPRLEPTLGQHAEIYAALVLGLSDYAGKNGFGHAVLGLSGGIDSALVAAIACDALGAGAVTAITMPSPYTSEGTRSDAGELAARLGCELREIPIAAVMEAYHQALEPEMGEAWTGVPYENVQARIRGNIVMALSNAYGWLALSTGNKSELAVGYSTLYGDMAGGFSVIKDVPKTLVFELADFRNGQGADPVIPQTIVDRPPSAELRPDQLDTDSLPPYEILDPILERYVELDHSPRQIAEELGHPETVTRVAAMVDRAEYKRRQGAPGVKITPRAFGRDRRLPITNRFGA